MDRTSPIWRFLSYLKPFLKLLVLTGGLVVILRLAELPAPLLYKALIDDAIPKKDVSLLIWLIVGLAAVLLGARIVSYFLQIMAARVQQGVLHNVRLSLVEHLQRLDLGFFRRHPTGGLLSRIMSDVTQVQAVLSRETFEVLASVLQVLIAGAFLLWLNPHLTLISGLVFPVLIGLVALFQKRLYRISRSMQQRRENLSARIQENLAGTRLIQSMALERLKLQQTSETSAKLRDTVVRSEVIGSSVNLLTIVLTDIPLTLFVWGYGGYMAVKGQLTLGSLLAFYQFLMMMYTPVIRIFRFNIQLQMARASVDRLYEVLDTEPAVTDAPGARPLEVPSGHLKFENLTLAYDKGGAAALRELDLEIKPGEVLGLVGPSGAGKTTLVNGLLRFVTPSKGRILIDGQDLEEVTLASLRGQIGMVSQEVFLFSDTLRANIALARPEAGQQQIEKAAQAAQAHDFITRLEKGYDTTIGERGLGLSGGEQQRISLARVILQDPPIFIFDEATSSLDAKSEALIQDALAELVKGRTTIIIAHRFSTLKLCHRIAVLSGGRLVEMGTHDELSARGGLYQALLKTQLLELAQDGA